MYIYQCFIQRVGNLGFPTPKLNFPPLSFTDFCRVHVLVLLSPSQEHLVPYLATSKTMILYEALIATAYFSISSPGSFRTVPPNAFTFKH